MLGFFGSFGFSGLSGRKRAGPGMLGALGLGFWVLGFRVWGLGGWVLGFRVSGFWVLGLRV